MDKYPLFGKLKENQWRQVLLENEKVKSLFEKLVNKAASKNIPLATITGHEDIICTVAKFEHINESFGKGETLLHWASSYEPAYGVSSSKVLVLLLLDADPNIQDNLGRTPLHWAVNHDCADIAEDKDIQYESNSENCAVKVVLQLLSFGASPDIVDVYGASALCHAVWSKCTDIAHILSSLTSDLVSSTPEFLLSENKRIKSIRCSNVDQWIQEKSFSVTENKERLQYLLSTPGIGLLQHQEEVETQIDQVIALFKRISSNIKREDPLLEFVPILAGSMAEGTKCQKPDEQDIILRLVKFENVCIPEESEHAPHGVITLKFNGNDAETKEYQKYILDGYLNREEILYSLITKLEKEVSLISNWSGIEIMNIYPSHDSTAGLKQAIVVGDIGTLSFIWHGNYYKQVKLSVDVVPAIIVKEWQPQGAITDDPTGRAVPNETFLILRAFIENFEYDVEIHGDFKSDTNTAGVDSSTLEILNGKDWDSGNECVSDNNEEECNKESVNATSDVYNTDMFRSLRTDFGHSISETKRILRSMDAFLNDIQEGQKNYKRVRTAVDDVTKFCSVETPNTSDSCFSDFRHGIATGQIREMERINRVITSFDSTEENSYKISESKSVDKSFKDDEDMHQNAVHDSTDSTETCSSNKKLNESKGEISNRQVQATHDTDFQSTDEAS